MVGEKSRRGVEGGDGYEGDDGIFVLVLVFVLVRSPALYRICPRVVSDLQSDTV